VTRSVHRPPPAVRRCTLRVAALAGIQNKITLPIHRTRNAATKLVNQTSYNNVCGRYILPLQDTLNLKSTYVLLIYYSCFSSFLRTSILRVGIWRPDIILSSNYLCGLPDLKCRMIGKIKLPCFDLLEQEMCNTCYVRK
jgi:hypothetical protein